MTKNTFLDSSPTAFPYCYSAAAALSAECASHNGNQPTFPACANDLAALFREQSVRHFNALFRYAMSLARNRSEAEDLVQETFLRASRAAPNLRPNTDIKSWMFTILRNIRLNQLRANREVLVETDDKFDPRSLSELEDPACRTPHACLLTKTLRLEVASAIAKLPEAYRQVIVLRELEQLSYLQISAQIGCPVGTIMSRLARARARLRSSLRQWHSEEVRWL